MEKKYFDLTTVSGKDLAMAYLQLNPLIALAFDLFKKMMSSDATKQQGKVVENLIKKGKEEGVSEMEIKIKNMKGLDFSAPIEGVDIKCAVGSKEDVIVKVKYK